MRYRIVYSTHADAHVRALTARNRAVLFDEVERQLTYQPTLQTRNRKQMRPNTLAPWELRIGNLRVYYDVTVGEDAAVNVIAVGVKKGNTVFISGEAWEFSDEND